jgi:VWFA-related protein
MPRLFSLFAALLLLPAMAMAQLQMSIDSLDVSAYPEVRMKVQVSDQGSSVRGLKVTNFTVFENGFVQPIIAGYCEDTLSRGPVSVLLLMDVSRSMGGWPWGNMAITDAKRAANSFVDRLSDDDEIALVSFSEQVYYNQPWTNNRALVKQRIDALNVISGTALWDAVLTSANLIRYREKKKVMIVLADGQDGASGNPASLAITYAIEAGCVVYTIGLGNDVDTGNMTRLASETGGRYYHAPSGEDLDQIYAEIIQQLETTGVCELVYRSPIDCWNGDEIPVSVQVSTTAGDGSDGTSYTLPYDTTTFSYVNVRMARDYVVEAGENITIPVELTRVSAQRAPSRFDFSVDFDPLLLQLTDVRVTGVASAFTVTSTPTVRGADVVLVGGTAIDTPGALCELTFHATERFESTKAEIGVSPPDVQQFCTIASSDNGQITISGTCERALLQGSGSLTKTRIVAVSPNPFASNATVRYHVGRDETLRLSVFDMMGREVSVLVDATRAAGDYSAELPAGGLPSGRYLVRLITATVSDEVIVTLTK